MAAADRAGLPGPAGLPAAGELTVRPEECIVCGGEKENGRGWVCCSCRVSYTRTASRRRQARRRYRLRLAKAWQLSRPYTHPDKMLVAS